MTYSQLAKTQNLGSCTKHIASVVTDTMNQKLLSVFKAEDVSNALHQMTSLKEPRPNGYLADFFPQNWKTVHVELCNAVLHFLNTGHLDASINSTYIALIPKIQTPASVSDYRPISLCNVLYKLISKVMATRLKEFLPFIISPYQSAFIPGRLITDNIPAAYETMHSNMWRKVGFVGNKLCMSKAYDRFE